MADPLVKQALVLIHRFKIIHPGFDESGYHLQHFFCSHDFCDSEVLFQRPPIRSEEKLRSVL
jgi:hypothetical protein